MHRDTGLISRLFNAAVPTAKVIWCQMSWKNYHQYNNNTDFQAAALFKGTTQVFAWKTNLQLFIAYTPVFRAVTPCSLAGG
jgi:hypothetical protein